MTLGTLPLILEPDPDDPAGALLLVDGTIDGVARRFILDTAAPRTRVVAGDELALTPVGSERSGGVFRTGDQHLASVSALTLGPVVIEALSVSLAPAGIERDLLGLDVLGRFAWRLSIAEATLTLVPTLEGDGALDLHIGAHGHPVVDLAWGEVSASGVWDTGASITVVDTAFVERHPLLFQRGGMSVGTDSTGATQETPTYLMRGPVMGGHRFDSHTVAAVDLSALNASSDRPTELILGFSTLCQATWVMDFPTRRWSVQEPSPAQRS